MEAFGEDKFRRWSILDEYDNGATGDNAVFPFRGSDKIEHCADLFVGDFIRLAESGQISVVQRRFNENKLDQRGRSHILRDSCINYNAHN